MLRSLSALLLVAVAQLGLILSSPEPSGTQATVKSTLNPELNRAWKQFTQAVRAKDQPALRQLSTACIKCSDCVTNTQAEERAFEGYKERHPTTWYDELHESLRFIPAEDFWRQDAPLIFDSLTTARLRDPAKLIFAPTAINKESFAAPCLLLPTQVAAAQIDEVMLTYIDPSEQGEGVQRIFAFVRTKQGYKFCGYTTIP